MADIKINNWEAPLQWDKLIMKESVIDWSVSEWESSNSFGEFAIMPQICPSRIVEINHNLLTMSLIP